MRILTLTICIFIISFSNSIGQQYDYDIQWITKANHETQNAKQMYPKDGERIPNSPLYKYLVKIPVSKNALAAEVELNILSSSDEKISFSPEDDFKTQIKSRIVTEKGDKDLFVEFLPYIQENSEWTPITTFSLNIQIKDQNIGAQKIPFKTESELKEGEIVRIAINNAGIYKIDGNFLQEAGFNLSGLDPNKVRILGHGGGYQPNSNAADRTDDLEEIYGLRTGLNDGSWSENDHILFYAEGADDIKIENDQYVYQKNIYSNKNYYFIQVGSKNAQEMSTLSNIPDPQQIFESYTSFQHLEDDKLNLLSDFVSTEGSGQKFYGDQFFNTTSFDYSNRFDFSNFLNSEPLLVKAEFAGRSSSTTSVDLFVGDQKISRTIGSSQTGKVLANYAKTVLINESIDFNGDASVNVDYNKGSDAEAKCWLDYIQIQGEKSLQYEGSPLTIRQGSLSDYSSAGFRISNASSNLKVWNITDHSEIKNHEISLENNVLFFTSINNNQLQEFLVFNPSASYPKPEIIGSVVNQNLHGLDNVNYVMLSHPNFISEANRLADFYRDREGANIVVIEIQDVFNEFSSGKLDPTAIRDFLRMLYERDANFNYVLLMGDGSYDPRGITEAYADKNYIPVFETLESLDPIDAYPTDDYYSFLDPDEGDDQFGAADIALGRLPCNTLTEARNMVDKIIRYQSNEAGFGAWRNWISFAADDEDGILHVSDADGIAELTEENHPVFNQKKVYFDAYPQETTPGGQRYPKVTSDLIKNIESGLIAQCYLGHGGPTGWAQERVLQSNHFQDFENLDNLCLFVTATCSFTGYDDPSITSAGEHAMLNPLGAAVALFTTTRAVFTSSNEKLTRAVFNNIFTREQGQKKKLGEIMRLAKNVNGVEGHNTRKFALIGDPFMYLNTPQHNISITEFNGSPVDTFIYTDTIKALQKVNLKGIVQDYSEQLLSDFNGELNVIVFDKESQTENLQNDPEESGPFTFNQRKNILFRGRASVINGQFDVEFILPKDIDFKYGPGRISLYATDKKTDAAGFYENFIVGGSVDNNLSDNDGPIIELFMNDESFVYGGTTHDEPIFLAHLSDENGINTSGTSIGHDLAAILDKADERPIILNEFYEAALDDYTSGKVSYPMDELTPGLHEIELTAWDILNNVSTAKLEFLVINSDGEGLNNVLNYPNPFSTKTQFMFEHDLANRNISIIIKIFSLSGKLLKTIETQSQSTGFREDGIMWDGRDDFGSKLANGVYLYKISIRDELFDDSRESDFEKLVIIN